MLQLQDRPQTFQAMGGGVAEKSFWNITDPDRFLLYLQKRWLLIYKCTVLDGTRRCEKTWQL